MDKRWGEKVPYVSPIECPSLEVAGGALHHDVLAVQTHQTLFRVAVFESQERWWWEGVWYQLAIRRGCSVRDLITTQGA